MIDREETDLSVHPRSEDDSGAATFSDNGGCVAHIDAVTNGHSELSIIQSVDCFGNRQRFSSQQLLRHLQIRYRDHPYLETRCMRNSL